MISYARDHSVADSPELHRHLERRDADGRQDLTEAMGASMQKRAPVFKD